MVRFLVSTALLLTLCWQPAALAGDDEFKMCARCHGADGNSSKPNFPSIAGFDAGYIKSVMEGYRDGSRACGLPMKCRMATTWTDEDIAAAAAYYSVKEPMAPTQEFDAGKAEAGKALHTAHCVGCHGAEAAADKPRGSLLSGQWRKYLEYALGQFEQGAWQQPDEMKAALSGLSADEIDALLSYYASGQP